MKRLDGKDYIEFITLHSASLQFRRSQEYLALLCRRAQAGLVPGQLRCYKAGREWFIHMLDLLDYINSQKSPAPRIVSLLKSKPELLKKRDSEIAAYFQCSSTVVYRARSEAGLFKKKRAA